MWATVLAGPRRTADEVADAVLLDTGDVEAKRSRYWTLLVLSAVIASAGVVADSTATVIGAMIIAPLATPIHGVAHAIVVGRASSLGTHLLLLVLGAATVVGVGAVVAGVLPDVVATADNSQITGRVSPGVVDMLAAAATGLAGAYAIARKDVGDILPGVAIAISLVPPLAVAGVTAVEDEPAKALGALLLFGTNVVAIIITACIVFTAVGHAREAADTGFDRRRAYRVVGATAAVLAVALVAGTVHTVLRESREAAALATAQEWAEENAERVVEAEYRGDDLHITVIGLGRGSEEELRRRLTADVPDGTVVVVDRLAGTRREIGRTGS